MRFLCPNCNATLETHCKGASALSPKSIKIKKIRISPPRLNQRKAGYLHEVSFSSKKGEILLCAAIPIGNIHIRLVNLGKLFKLFQLFFAGMIK